MMAVMMNDSRTYDADEGLAHLESPENPRKACISGLHTPIPATPESLEIVGGAFVQFTILCCAAAYLICLSRPEVERG